MSARLHIAMVVGEFPQLSESFIYRKAVGLAAAGHRVTVLTRRICDVASFPPLPSNVTLRQLPAEVDFSATRIAGTVREAARTIARSPRVAALTRGPAKARLRSVYRHLPFLDLEADIIHFEFLGLPALYPFASALTSAPWVVSCRGTDIHLLPQRDPATRELLLGVLSSAPAIHCVSDAMASSIRALGITSPIWVNRPAIDTTEITPQLEKARRVPEIIAVGRLVWIKGYDYLLEAFARVLRNGARFRATIIGDGPLRAAFEYSIEQLGLSGIVTLAGPMPPAAVIKRLRDADVFVLGSHNEGISNAVLEAMACGLPVVTTDSGGMREAVRDGIDGLVVPVRDVDAIASALGGLLVDKDLRARMGRSAREHAVAEFSLGRQVATFEAMYRSVVAAA